MVSRVPTHSQVFVSSIKVTDKFKDGPWSRQPGQRRLAGAVYRSESQGRELWQGRVLREDAPSDTAGVSPSSTSIGLV